MRATHRWSMAFLAAALSLHAAAADDPTKASTYSHSESWSRVQARLSLGLQAPGLLRDGDSFESASPRLSSVSVLGDYYLSRPFSRETTGGLRATSGILLGPRAPLWGGLPSKGLFQVDLRPGQAPADGTTDNQTVPYVGIGYTGVSLRQGWGYSVDLGLMALHPRSASQLGSVLNGTQSLDTTLRELRLSPILQLGVSYRF